MIVAGWQGGSIIVDREELVAATPDVRAIAEGILHEPAPAPAGFVVETTITDATIMLQPGQAGHARAALRRLAGISFVWDDGSDLEAADE